MNTVIHFQFRLDLIKLNFDNSSRNTSWLSAEHDLGNSALFDGASLKSLFIYIATS